ncbi:hypothetical protein UP10_38490 [Bradyrhizobium sp. LTSPM299]|uniref:hypothetical protein n=1 Tax=Bradyrhizobium sp. LTSPM299 TaxID=1619233 RepID=UPI0005CAA0A2|nr:hypothetical protein [Bradyrhizobium sp. LTSPM299]KJC55781.1 hypothetical protein UP10_38490 [Bradyrhizobium sp. LTSPM299]
MFDAFSQREPVSTSLESALTPELWSDQLQTKAGAVGDVPCPVTGGARPIEVSADSRQDDPSNESLGKQRPI